ncbi:hypothetical protein ACLQ9Z_13655, partial [Bordetella avium]
KAREKPNRKRASAKVIEEAIIAIEGPHTCCGTVTLTNQISGLFTISTIKNLKNKKARRASAQKVKSRRALMA